MSSTTVRIVSPTHPLDLTLESDPIATKPIRLSVVVEDGDRDLTEYCKVEWVLTWIGSYKHYQTTVAQGADVITRLPIGGTLMTAWVQCEGERHRARFHLKVRGRNPSRELVKRNTQGDDFLRAVLWHESEGWNQFTSDGEPNKNKDSSARGIGQVLEKIWDNDRNIPHHEYPRIVWQWDYAIEASREILRYYHGRARKHRPHADAETLLDWTAAFYAKGDSARRDKEIDKERRLYVKRIRDHMYNKPWDEH
jgi:hypothetical protein